MEKIDARQIGRNLAPQLVHIVALRRRIAVMADQRQRLGAGRRVAPAEMLVFIVRQGDMGPGVHFAECKFGRNGATVLE